MRRIVSLWLPTFATDRLRSRENPGLPTGGQMRAGLLRPDEAPLVLWRHDGRRQVVASANRAAYGLGLRPGAALAQARAMVPGLAMRPSEPQAERAALDRLALWCLRYAPICAPDAPDGIWIDITGCAHLHQADATAAQDVGPVATLQEARLLEDLVAQLWARGFAARAAAADTPGAAHALARHAPVPVTVAPPGTTAAALAGLPVAGLRLEPEVATALARLGLCRVEQLAGAARAPLARRFGAGLLRRLDQALGRAAEPIVPMLPVEPIGCRYAFEEPLLDAGAFAMVIARLSGAVCAMLERAGLGARQLDLVFERVDGSAQAVRIGTARLSRDPAHLARLLCERLQSIDSSLGVGPSLCIDPGLGVEAMRLGVGLSEPMVQAQLATDGSAEAQDPLAALVDRLENRLGRGRVYRAVPVESDVPERSVRMVPALSPPSGLTWPRLARPVRLLDPPQPVEAVMSLLPDQPPAVFTWRRVRYRVRQADGPERIAGEWWRRAAEMRAVRDYWQVEDEAGRRFWLFRAGDGEDITTGNLRWFLHGLF